ncbi:MAG: hypothetical protein JNL10_00285 [Verrucomicrobiales bacterium]|nr:hypothetical protein [Verrucomicrobiales bacterium]
MKDPRHPEDPLARWAGNVLGQLPDRTAPPSLAPRILAAVARHANRPWYQRPWVQWPVALQWVAVALMLSAIAAAWGLLLPRADAVGTTAAELATSQLDLVRPVGSLASMLGALGNALLLILRGLNSWVTVAGVGILALFWSTTLGLGTACWRLAGGGSGRD